MGSNQEVVFERTAKPLLSGVLDGFNATVFAYGVSVCHLSLSVPHSCNQGHWMWENAHNQRNGRKSWYNHSNHAGIV